MRRNRLETAVKALYLGASVVLTASIITMGVIQFRQAKRLSNVVHNNIEEVTYALSNSDVMQFDGMEVTGSDVVNFCKKYLNERLSKEDFTVTITTDKTRIYTDNTCIIKLRSYTADEYVNPTELFIGQVSRNENGVILDVNFTVCQ